VIEVWRRRNAIDEASKNLPKWSIVRLHRKEEIKRVLANRSDNLLTLEPVTVNSAIHCSLAVENIEILHMLLKDGRLLPDARNNSHQTALHVAALNGNLGKTEILIRHGANLNIQDR
jgi:ankyrin repeat protein